MISDNSIELITASIDYPELNIVKLDGAKNYITFELAFDTPCIESQFSTLDKLKKCLHVYHKLKSIKPEVFKLEVQHNLSLCFVRFKRDIVTMTLDELKLFISLTNKFWGDILIRNEQDYERCINKKYFKKNLVEQLYSNNNSSYLVYRENGNIIVQNK